MRIHSVINARVTRLIIFFATLAFEALLGARVYFMIHGGTGFIQIAFLEDVLSGVMAAGVALLAAVLFVLGGYLRRAGQHYDLGHGKYARIVVEIDEKGNEVKRSERYNRFATAWWVNVLIVIVLLVEWAAIYMTAPVGEYRNVFIVGYFTLSLVLPIIGHLLYASVNVPISSFVAEGDREEALVRLRTQEAERKTRLRELAPPKTSGWLSQIFHPPVAAPSVRITPDAQTRVAPDFPKALPQGPSGQSGQSGQSNKPQQHGPNNSYQPHRGVMDDEIMDRR